MKTESGQRLTEELRGRRRRCRQTRRPRRCGGCAVGSAVLFPETSTC